MQNTILCYMKMVYLNLDFIASIPSWIKVKDLINLLNQRFPCDLVANYVFEGQSNRILDSEMTILQNKVLSGSYLYLI